MIIPPDWLVPAHPKRVILHWTAGGYAPSIEDLAHYHILIKGGGAPVRGDHAISANDSTLDADGYAAHTYRCNTMSIGLALCCMKDAVESPFHPGTHPMKPVQWSAMIAAVAQIVDCYGIGVSPETVLTHAEVSHNLGIPQKGKWDITVRFINDSLRKDTAHNVGELIRNAVEEYRATRVEKPVAPTPFCDLPTLWPGDETPRLSVRVLEHCLGLNHSLPHVYDDGLVNTVKQEQDRLGLKGDGIVGPKTWARLLGL